MKNWTMGRFCEYYNGLPPQGRERFLYIIWQVFHIGTAHSITDAIFGAAAADDRESKMRAERDQAQRELWTSQQETLAVRAEKEAQTRQKSNRDGAIRLLANRTIELEHELGDAKCKLSAAQKELEASNQRGAEYLKDLDTWRNRTMILEAKLEAADGAAKTLSRLLAAAEDKAAK